MERDKVAAQFIAYDLKKAGFNVRHNLLSGGMIVSLKRHLGTSEVKDALNAQGYDDCQFTIKPYNGMVVVAAVVA